jgi:hypothetical protein
VTTLPGQTLENWTVRLKHTGLSSYPATPEWENTGWTIAYQADLAPGQVGWRTFVFTTPFAYNGTDNLLVDFSFNNASWSTDGHCRSTTHGVHRTICHSSNSTEGDPLAWAGTSPVASSSKRVPNLRLDVVRENLGGVPISPTVTSSFEEGVWAGTVTVHQAVSPVFLRATHGSGPSGDSDAFEARAGTP